MTMRAMVCVATGLLTLASLAEPPVLKHNPFVAPPGAHSSDGSTAATGWTLRATLVDDHASLANINGELVAPGDRITNATVVAIQEGRVVLDTKTGEVVLTLPSSSSDDNVITIKREASDSTS